MRISARNNLAGEIRDVQKGAVNAEVTIALKSGDLVTAVITNSSVDSLGLRKGTAAYAVIKASDVMVGIDE